MEDNKYPLATLMILFYKQEKFVKDAVEGALSQTYSNLEIILSDDNSPDRTFEVIQECVKDYQGPHKIVLNKNEKNMGLVPHVNKLCFDVAKGDYIFLNGGDDISLPNRVQSGVEAFIKHPEVAAVTFSRIIIDKDGKEKGRVREKGEHVCIIDSQYLSQDTFMAGAGALSYRKDKMEDFGKLNSDCQTEDSVLRFRALMQGGILSLPDFGLKYRIHDNNISRYVSNFETDLIAKQYEKDLLVKKNEMPSELYNLLLGKIAFYRRLRALQVKKEQTKNYFSRILLDYKINRLRNNHKQIVMAYECTGL